MMKSVSLGWVLVLLFSISARGARLGGPGGDCETKLAAGNCLHAADCLACTRSVLKKDWKQSACSRQDRKDFCADTGTKAAEPSAPPPFTLSPASPQAHKEGSIREFGIKNSTFMMVRSLMV